jgi:hypothetical protein
MGYLTTVTIYNDGLDLLKKHPVDFCNKLYNASLSQKPTDFGVGYFCNFAKVQQTRHADDHTTYVHMGNCLTEVNPYSKEFKHLINSHPEFVDRLIDFLECELEQLKRLQRKSKEAKPS